MTWDLRNDLAEIPVEEDTVQFTMNFKLLAEVRKLRQDPNADPANVEQKEAELKAATYTVEMMSVPRRRRDDIYEEALDAFPNKPMIFGNQVDEKVAFQRGNYVRVQLVAAATKRIISPSGDAQEENLLEAIQMIHDEAPDVIFAKLERKEQELRDEQDAQDELHQSADF